MSKENSNIVNKENWKKYFSVKSLLLYPDNPYEDYNNNRPLKVFNYYNFGAIFFKLILVNKNFGKSDYELNINFALSYTYGNIFFDYNINKKISKEESQIDIVFEFDMHGFEFPEDKENLPIDYNVSYWLDEELLKSKDFVFDYGGDVNEVENPFFDIKKVILFRDDHEINHTIFDKNITEYIYVRLICEYRLEEREFFKYELFFTLKDIKKRIISEFRSETEEGFDELGEVFHYDDEFLVDAQIKSEVVSKLKPGIYTIELEFFNVLIKEISFEISDYDEIISDDESRSHSIINTEVDISFGKDDSEFLEGLNNLIGLDEIKDKLKEIRNFKKYLKEKSKHLKNVQSHKDRFHFWFAGNPGTGKTKVALELGKILKNMGIVSKGHVHSVGRNNLIGKFIGETAIQTAEAIEKARGGILFIDEAYSLFKGSSYKDYGSEVIEVLLREMSGGKGDLSIIVAGYPNEMELLKNSNPGLFSRFSYVFEFPDFNPTELLKIAKRKSKSRGLTISNKAIDYLKKKIEDIYRAREDNFGNARFINFLVEKAEINLASRSSKYGENKIELKLETEDFKAVFKDNKREKYNIEIDELALENSLNELNNLTGIKNIKTEIEELTRLLKYYQEEGIDIEKRNFSLHTVFKGNPGTGKTTVARILARIYKSLGVLEKGHIIECDRSGLVKGYIGQTAIQTNQMIDRAMGGILFIDEAYSLTNKSERDFGIEAIEIILKRMEDSRGKFIVICAGYTDEMNFFLDSNPGLKSRFDKVFDFIDYTEEELFEILESILSYYNLELKKDEVIYDIKEKLSRILKSKDKHFGNAREIRKVAEQIVRNHDLRLASLSKYERTKLNINDIEIEDLKINISELKKEERKIGFTLYE
jgi:SpoVK/Ycf46/Vps4 family AAA+-type ATPase